MGSDRPDNVHLAQNNGPSVIDWCAVSKKEVNGPCFFENENVIGEAYERLFRYSSFSNLRVYPGDTNFQQYDAPTHFLVFVSHYLDHNDTKSWIRRAGPISWPPQSPDSTPVITFYGEVRKVS